MKIMVATVEHREAQDNVMRWVIDPARRLIVSQPAGLMGILNVTPDSFSDGGLHLTVAAAVTAGIAMIGDGATWLDVGGESSRPGAEPVSSTIECQRVVPVIAALRAAGMTAPISIDTTKAEVAEAALLAGASTVNDISAGSDPAMFPLIASHACPVVLMHMQGTPRTMQVAPTYADVVDDVCASFERQLTKALAAGIAASAIMLDPGIGFGKTPEHNLALLRALPRLHATFARPLVVGVSRKSLLSALVGQPLTASQRDGASHILHALIAEHCALLRVHDVVGARHALTIAQAMRGSTDGGVHAP
jgi:dihydropteroate synthase